MSIKITNFFIYILSTVLYLVIIYIVSLLINNPWSNVIQIWGVLLTPIFFIIIKNKNIKEQQTETFKTPTKLKILVQRINNLPFPQSLFLLIIFTIVVYIILAIFFKIDLTNMNVYTIIAI